MKKKKYVFVLFTFSGLSLNKIFSTRKKAVSYRESLPFKTAYFIQRFEVL